jgi:hypothetical protein
MMMKKKIRYKDPLPVILSIVTILIFSGCQKVINVDLNEATPHIVIEGLITDRSGPYVVTISKSGSYFNQPVLPPVSGAVVIITDDAGTIDTLKETKPGIYLTSKTRGIPGRTYTLKVLSENKEYTGSSTMHNHVGIDSLNLIKSQSQHFDFGGDNKNEINVDVFCCFKDPGEKNFYRIKVTRNDTTRFEDYRLYDDQYTNGQETGLRVSRAKAGDTDRIELFSLDRQTYGYYRTLEDLIHTNPIFGSTPANPNTNLNNGALGYFGACAISSRTIIITNFLLNTLR